LFLRIGDDFGFIFPEIVVGQVFGELEEPGGEVAAALIGIEVFEHLDVGVLHQVLGRLSIFDQGHDHGVNPVFGRLVDRGKGLFVF